MKTFETTGVDVPETTSEMQIVAAGLEKPTLNQPVKGEDDGNTR